MSRNTLTNLLTAFSPREEYLALCSGDGRIKIWDTVNGSIKVDFADLPASATGNDVVGHLAVDYTCMAWNPAIKKGKKKHCSFMIGLGTGSGDVLLLDAALGKPKWKFQDCHPGGVKSLAFNKSGSILYTSGADGMICEFEADLGRLQGKFKGSKNAITCIAISGDGKHLVAGSNDIRLFDLSSRKRLRKYAGHPDAVKALEFTKNDSYFLSSAVGERHITMWQNNESNNGAPALCSLSMEHPALSIDCSGEPPGHFRILAVSESGVAYVWQAEGMEELSQVKPIKVTVAHSKGEIFSGSKSIRKSMKTSILAAKFAKKSEKGPGFVFFAFGTTVKPSFEQVSLEGKGERILLQANENGALMPQVQPSEAIANKGPFLEAITLGPDNAVDADKPRALVEFDEAAVKPSKRKKRQAREEGQIGDLDGLTQHGTENMHVDRVSQDANDQSEETMEEKLKALGIIGDEGEDEEEQQGSLAPLKADSIQVLMTQALESDDKALLGQCLSVTDNKVITKTVQMLNPSVAAKFLEKSVYHLDSRTGKALVLVPWIKAILLYHASYMMSNPSMQPLLNFLYQVIESRVSVFQPLLSLSGRLDLIMAQVARTDSQEPAAAAAAVVVYEESDDEEGVEDVVNADNVEADGDISEDELSGGSYDLSGGSFEDGKGSLDVEMEDSDEDNL